jgi:hypothetical protein
MRVQFTDAQKKAIDEIVERRLQRERLKYERQMFDQHERYERELERVRLELRQERSLITRIRDWLSV